MLWVRGGGERLGFHVDAPVRVTVCVCVCVCGGAGGSFPTRLSSSPRIKQPAVSPIASDPLLLRGLALR